MSRTALSEVAEGDGVEGPLTPFDPPLLNSEVGVFHSRGCSMPAWFYILRLQSKGLYPGSTRDKERRYRDHFAGRGCRTTQLDPPISIAYEEEYATYRLARIRELQVKRWSRKKKVALVSGDLILLRKLSQSNDS